MNTQKEAVTTIRREDSIDPVGIIYNRVVYMVTRATEEEISDLIANK